MKKPSLRIKEIQEAGEKEINLDGPGLYYKISTLQALIQYLDEEWEKQQPCKEHKYVDIAGLGEVCERCFKTRITPV